MPLFTGFFTSQVVQDLFHQQYVDTFDTRINRISFRRWRKQRNWPGNRKLNEYGSKWWGWFLGGASCSMVQRSLPCPAEFDRGLQKCWRGQPWSNPWKTHLEKRYRDDPTGRQHEKTHVAISCFCVHRPLDGTLPRNGLHWNLLHQKWRMLGFTLDFGGWEKMGWGFSSLKRCFFWNPTSLDPKCLKQNFEVAPYWNYVGFW